MKHCFSFEFLSTLYVGASNSEKGTSAFNVAWGDFADFPFNWSINVELLQQVVNMTQTCLHFSDVFSALQLTANLLRSYNSSEHVFLLLHFRNEVTVRVTLPF